MFSKKFLPILFLLVFCGNAKSADPVRAYQLTIHYAAPPDIFPGVKVTAGEPSPLVGSWLVSGRIPQTAEEVMDPAFQAGISNETVARFLESRPGAPFMRGQMIFIAKKLRAIEQSLSTSLYAMEDGNAAFGTEWEYNGETGIAKAFFPYRGQTIFVRLERMPIHVLLPVEVEP